MSSSANDPKIITTEHIFFDCKLWYFGLMALNCWLESDIRSMEMIMDIVADREMER